MDGEGRVELLVQAPAFIWQPLASELFKRGSERRQNGGRHTTNRQARRLYLEKGADRINFTELAGAKGLKDRPAVAAQLDHPQCGQFEEAFAHRGAADAKELGNRGLGEAFASLPSAMEQTADDS